MEANKTLLKVVSIVVGALLLASVALNIVGITLFLNGMKKMEEMSKPSEPVEKEIKNVILLIGDGMGFNHLEQTKKFYNLESLNMESMDVARCTTDSVDGGNQYICAVTDSAAAGTALATGYKTVNGRVARSATEEYVTLKSIMKYAQEEDKMTGVITTDDLYGATPSAFSSNSSSRTNYDSLLERQFVSGIDLLVGGIVEGDKTSARAGEIRAQGYTYTTDYNSLLAAKEDDKIYGVIPTLHSEYAGDNHVELSDVTEFALDYLSKDEDGFMMMVEGARIDKFSHSNIMDGMVDELRDFDETIAACLAWASQRDDTVVLVTADHETGGITLTPENNEYRFTTGNHSGVPVPLFSYGVDLNESLYDNTDVFRICLSLCQTGKYED